MPDNNQSIQQASNSRTNFFQPCLGVNANACGEGFEFFLRLESRLLLLICADFVRPPSHKRFPPLILLISDIVSQLQRCKYFCNQSCSQIISSLRAFENKELTRDKLPISEVSRKERIFIKQSLSTGICWFLKIKFLISVVAKGPINQEKMYRFQECVFIEICTFLTLNFLARFSSRI